jgi:hypothetical protein
MSAARATHPKPIPPDFAAVKERMSRSRSRP